MTHGRLTLGILLVLGTLRCALASAPQVDSAQEAAARPIQTQATNTNPQAKVVDPAQERIRKLIEAFPLVAQQMTAAEVQDVLTRIGLLPLEKSQHARFSEALASALALADTSRQILMVGQFKELVDGMAAIMTVEGSPSNAQSALVKSVRGKAFEIDRALITAAIQAIVDEHDPQFQPLIATAAAVRQADAATETIRQQRSQLPFISLAAAWKSSAQLSETERAGLRSLLLTDAIVRADLAQRISFDWLEGEVLLGERQSDQLKLGLIQALANEVAVDPKQLAAIAVLIQLRGVLSAASEVARLDATLLQMMESQLPIDVAFSVASALEDSAPGGSVVSRSRANIPDLARQALALKMISPSQSKAIRDAVGTWKHAEIESFRGYLLAQSSAMSAVSAFAKGLVAGDPATWDLGSESPSLQRFFAYRQRQAERQVLRQLAAKSLVGDIEAILGPELWEVVSPRPVPVSKPGNKLPQ